TMAANRLRKFKTIEDTANFLNGAIIGGSINKAQGAPSNNAPGITGLVGTTLTFATPAVATVTFTASVVPLASNPNPATLFFKDIKAQIEAVMAGLRVYLNQDQQLVMVEKTPSSGVSIQSSSAGGLAVMLGTVDLRTLTYGPGGALAGKTLTLEWDLGAPM